MYQKLLFLRGYNALFFIVLLSWASLWYLFVCQLEDRKWVLENRARRHLFYYGLLSRMRASAPHPPSVEQYEYKKNSRIESSRPILLSIKM